MRMTMRAMRASTVLLLSFLALGSCGLLFLTPFSSDLAQTLAVRDFSKEIDDPSLDNFQPFVLERVTGSETTRLILLVGGQPYPDKKPWLFILKEDLSLAQDPFTLADMYNKVTAPAPFNGTRAMVDSDGQVVVGNALFDITDGALTSVGPAGDLDGLYGWGFPTAALGDNVISLGSSGTKLRWDRYNSCWTLQASDEERFIRSNSRNLWLRNVLADSNPATAAVILAFEEDKDPATDTSTTYFVKVLRNRFNGSLPDYFLDDALNYPSTTKTDLESSHMGYTSDGIVAYEHSSQSWIIFPFEAPNVVQSMGVGDISDDLENQRFAWSYSGGYACVYDRRSRTLSKVAKWWK
jgi:hypothetical protein